MKHFLSLSDCTTDELRSLLALSVELKQRHREGTLAPTLQGKILAMVFEKASLRTRMSFETAMINLGGHGIYLKPEDIGILGQREPIKDMARVFSRYIHGIMARTFAHESLIELARYADVPVINALSDWSHPCQAMADALTIQEHFGSLDGRRIAFIGDGNNVARSLAFLVAKLGMTLVVASPAGYELDRETVERANAERTCVRLTHSPEEAVEAADVIYTDTWVSMGQEAETQRRIADFAGFQVDTRLLERAPGAKVMHCLPAHRGHEITDEVFESPNSIIFDQAENRLHFQRALLQHLMAG